MKKETVFIGLAGAVTGMLVTAVGVGIGYFVATRNSQNTTPPTQVAAQAKPPAETAATTGRTPGAPVDSAGQQRPVSAGGTSPGWPVNSMHAGLPTTIPADMEKFQVGQSNVKTILADGPLVWVGTSFGLIKYDYVSDRHEVFNNKNSPLLSNGIFYLAKFDDQLWVGTYGGGLHVFDGTSKWRSYNIPHGLADGFVYGVTKAPNGDIWIATWSGANRILEGRIDDPAAWLTYTVENTEGGLPNDWVYAVSYDSKGNIWLGTEGGVALFDGANWKSWKHDDGLGAPYELVKDSLLKTPDTASGKSKHHQRQKIEMGLQEINVPFNPNYIVSMFVDERDRVWLGTWGGGLSIFENGKFTTYAMNDGLTGNYVSMITKGSDHVLWVGSNQGLSRVQETDGKVRFINYTVADGLYSRAVFSMAFSDNRSVWVGSYGGVAHYPSGLPQKGVGQTVIRLLPGQSGGPKG